MTPNVLFQAALQLKGSPWRVVRSDFSGEPPTLEIGLDFARGSQFRERSCCDVAGKDLVDCHPERIIRLGVGKGGVDPGFIEIAFELGHRH